MRDKDGWVGLTARPARGQQRLLQRNRFGLDEQLVERGCCRSALVRRHVNSM